MLNVTSVLDFFLYRTSHYITFFKKYLEYSFVTETPTITITSRPFPILLYTSYVHHTSYIYMLVADIYAKYKPYLRHINVIHMIYISYNHHAYGISTSYMRYTYHMFYAHVIDTSYDHNLVIRVIKYHICLLYIYNVLYII